MRAEPGEKNAGIPGFFVYIAGRVDACRPTRGRRGSQDGPTEGEGLVPCPPTGWPNATNEFTAKVSHEERAPVRRVPVLCAGQYVCGEAHLGLLQPAQGPRASGDC
jgi:hypothetical protein